MEFSDVFSTRTGIFFKASCPSSRLKYEFYISVSGTLYCKKQTLTVLILQAKERNKNIVYKWLTKNSFLSPKNVWHSVVKKYISF